MIKEKRSNVQSTDSHWEKKRAASPVSDSSSMSRTNFPSNKRNDGRFQGKR